MPYHGCINEGNQQCCHSQQAGIPCRLIRITHALITHVFPFPFALLLPYALFLLRSCFVSALFLLCSLFLPCSCSIPALFLPCSCPVPALLLPCSCPAPYSDEMQCRQCISFSPYAERHPFHRYRHLKHWFRSQGISAGFLFPGKSGKYTALLYRSKAAGHLPERE